MNVLLRNLLFEQQIKIKCPSQEFGGCPLYATLQDAGGGHFYFFHGAGSNCDYIMGTSITFCIVYSAGKSSNVRPMQEFS